MAAAVFLAALCVRIAVPSPAYAGEEHAPAAPTRLFLTGTEQAVVDSYAPKSDTLSAEQFSNSLDHALTVLSAQAWSRPDPEALARNTVQAVCEEFRRKTGTRISDEEREKWIETARRDNSFEGMLKDIETRVQGDPNRTSLIHSGLEGMISKTQPPFAWLLGRDEAERFKEMLATRKAPEMEPGLIGIRLDKWPVVGVLPDSPAAQAGMHDGDSVLAVDGKDITDVKEIRKAGRLLSGPAGKTVALKVRRGGDTINFEIRRASMASARVTANLVEPGILCVRIPTFEGRGIAEKVTAIIRKCVHEGVRVIIMDLRNNPGGRPEESDGVADIFLDNKLLWTIEFPGSECIGFKSNPGALHVEVVVLVNKATGSAAESLALALQDHDRGTIIGETTASVLFVKDAIALANGEVIVFRAAGTVRSPKGRDHSREGVTPDLALRDATGPDGDAMLRAAIEFVHSRKPSKAERK